MPGEANPKNVKVRPFSKDRHLATPDRPIRARRTLRTAIGDLTKPRRRLRRFLPRTYGLRPQRQNASLGGLHTVTLPVAGRLRRDCPLNQFVPGRRSPDFIATSQYD